MNMRFRSWLETTRDRNAVVQPYTHDPFVNTLIDLFGRMGVKVRSFDIEDYFVNRSGTLSGLVATHYIDPDEDAIVVQLKDGRREEADLPAQYQHSDLFRRGFLRQTQGGED